MKLSDFVKANAGMYVLVTIFFVMLGLAFFVFIHIANPAGGDFLSWLEGKIGEVLAAIMTITVGGVTAGRRAGDGSAPTNGGAPKPTLSATSHDQHP